MCCPLSGPQIDSGLFIFWILNQYDEVLGTKVVKSMDRGVAQMARVLRLGRRGREFESHHPDIFQKNT